MPSNDSTELWFPVTDLLPLVEQCLSAPGHTADAQHGDLPALHLTAQGDALFYLATNAVPALLVDAFDPTSRQRVYALGYGHGAGSLTHPADADRYRPATQLASIPLVSGGGRFGNLADRLRLAAGIGCDWFVLALHPDGRLDVSVRPTPRPSPAARRRHARLELAGLPGRWPGQFVTNAAHDGWLLARFTCEVGQQIATAVADLAATAVVPHPLTTVELADTPTAQRSATAPAGVVGVDPEGFYRVGVGWPWVSLDLLPNGLLVPYTGPIRSGIDPAQGQYAFTGMGHLMWLDDNQNLVLRPAGDDSADLLNLPGPPQYGTFDPDAEWQLRAVEHALPNAAAGPTAFTGLAAAFTAQEVEALIITAADVAVGGGMESLSRRQLELAHRAYALLLADADEPTAEEAGRS